MCSVKSRERRSLTIPSWEETEGSEDTGVKIWCCQLKWKLSFRVYLVLAKGGMQISSTHLRKELNENEGEELVEELETMALSPRLLASMIQAGQVMTNRVMLVLS
jgi:hypothetical protein